MNEDTIRKKFQREDKNDIRGKNIEAVNRFIEMLKKQENSTNINIRKIAENFENIDKIAPNFVIFQCPNGTKCNFMKSCNGYQIGTNTSSIVASHEFGHAVLEISGNNKVPNEFEGILERAKQHAKSPEIKEFFKEYIIKICDSNNPDVTEEEKGPVSDIISAVFQVQAFNINREGNTFFLPSSHKTNYYYDENNKDLNLYGIYDECFANFYALESENCIKEINALKNLFGVEFLSLFENALNLSTEKICKRIEDKDNQYINNESSIEDKER